MIDDHSVTHAAVAHCGLPPPKRPCDNMIVDHSVTHADVAQCGLPPDERPSTNTIDDRSVTLAVVANPVVVHPKNAHVDDHVLKQCPNCEIDIQKIGGCNRMHCTACGHFFCWLCLGDYVAYGKHFCGKENMRDPLPEIRQQRFAAVTRKGTYIVSTAFVETALNQANHDQLFLRIDPRMVGETNATLQKLRDLARYGHFYNRYYIHNRSQKFAENQCPCLSTAEENYGKMADIRSWADLSFIRHANEVLVASRRLLKYTYCSAFHSKRLGDNDTKNFHLGFFHLEKLERFTEELSEVSENALTRQDRTRVLDLVRMRVCEPVLYAQLCKLRHLLMLSFESIYMHFLKINVVSKCMDAVAEFERYEDAV
jgi:hypothetical protein